MASSSARRASRSSIDEVGEAMFVVDCASGERNLSAMAASLLDGLVFEDTRQPHIGLTRLAIWA